MVYTELASRRQQFHVAPAMQKTNNAVSARLRWILIIRSVKSMHSLIQNQMRIEYSGSGREQRMVLNKSGQYYYYYYHYYYYHYYYYYYYHYYYYYYVFDALCI